MKWVMVIAAMLTLPALAFGAASFTLEINGGGSEITIADLITASGLLSVNVGIDADDPSAGFDVALAASTDDDVTMVTRTMHLGYWSASKLDKALFTTYKMLKTSALGDQNLGGVYDYINCSWSVAEVANTQTVNLSIDTAAVTTYLATNDSYAISISGAGLTGLHILDDSTPSVDVYDTGATLAQVLITPEPASLLLLIGALPFLRRRR